MYYNSLIPDTQYDVDRYIKYISKYEILTADEEKKHIDAWVNQKDISAAQILVHSHLRLVVKIAMKFKQYGLQMMDLIAEGNLGLMKAIKNFNPEYKARISTYADFWIRASIQKYILSMWSIAKIGTTRAQRKLFYNLRKLQKKFNNSANQIAKFLGVNEQDVSEMDTIMSCRDQSFDAPSYNSDSDVPYIDTIVESSNNEEVMLEKIESKNRRLLVHDALNKLDDRSKDIIESRILKEKPITLAKLAAKYNVSSERIRQLTNIALATMKKNLSEVDF